MSKIRLSSNDGHLQSCIIDGCDKPFNSYRGGGRGMCAMHRARVRRHGDPSVCKLMHATACAVNGCDNQTRITKGYCTTHYLRLMRFGTPHYEPRQRRGVGSTAEERFWSRVQKEPNGCWRWTGRPGSHGYGQITVNYRSYTTHRYAWLLTHGSLPTQMLLHSCDSRLCVNPAHLREGTAKDNARDMVERGRSVRGEQQRVAKLREADVHQILTLLKQGCVQKVVARQFGVSPSVVSDIKAQRTWRHIDRCETL